MKVVIGMLSFIILLGCSGESTSQASSAVDNLPQETANKESSVLGLFGKKNAEKYVISSPIEGRLVKDGKPMENTKIIRRLRWNGNEEGVVDEFITDDTGYFSIPAHEEFLSIGTLAQFVSNIELFSESETDDNFFWYNNKFNGEVFSDFGGPIVDLICDTNKKEEHIELKHGAVYSKCLWDNMPEANSYEKL